MAENVTIRFDAAGIRRTRRRLEQVREKLEDIGITGARIRRAFRAMRTAALAGAAALAAVGAASAALVREATQAGSALEQTGIRLDSIMGSAEEGAASLDALREAAAQLPFTFQEITDVAPTLGVISDDAEELQRRLFQAAEISARFGISLRETAGNMVRFFTAGAASADLFRERGVLQALGVVAGEQTTLQESKRLWREFFTDIERSGSSALGRLAESFEGRLSMVQDAWFQLMANMAESGVMDAVKRALSAIQQALEDFVDSGAAQEFADSFTSGLATAVSAFGSLLETIDTVVSAIRTDAGEAFKNAGIVIGARLGQGLFEGLETVLRESFVLSKLPGPVGDFFNRINLAGAGAGAVADVAGQSASEATEALQILAGDGGALSRAADKLEEIAAALRGKRGAGGVGVSAPRLSGMRLGVSTAELLGLPQFRTTAAQEMMIAPGPTQRRRTVGMNLQEIGPEVQRALGITTEALDRLEDAAFSAGEGFNRVADVAITSMSQAVQAAITGFDNIAAIVINTVTQIVQALGRSGGPLSGFLGGFGVPLVGAIGGILGAIVSGGGSDRPQPVEVKNRDPIPVEDQRDRGPSTVILNLRNAAGELTERQVYDLRRRERRDAVQRIPTDVNLAGA